MKPFLDTLFLGVNLLLAFSLVASVPVIDAHNVSIYLDGKSDNLRGLVSLSINGGVPRFVMVVSADWKFSSVICRQLGAGPPIQTFTTIYKTVHGRVWLYSVYNIHCNGWENSLADCQADFSKTFMDSSSIVLEIECAPATPQGSEVLLVKQSQSADEGIVLTYLDGRWGPILGEHTNSDGIICQQMGYQTGQKPLEKILGVQVFSNPVLVNLQCKGDEQMIQECSFTRINNQTLEWVKHGTFYETSCFDTTSYDDVKPTSFANSLDDFSIYPDHQSAGPVKILPVIAVMTVSLVICLRCGIGSRSDGRGQDQTQVDMGDQIGPPHRYERYHTGSGHGYQLVPLHQVPPSQYQGPPYHGYQTGPNHGPPTVSAPGSQVPPRHQPPGYQCGPALGSGVRSSDFYPLDLCLVPHQGYQTTLHQVPPGDAHQCPVGQGGPQGYQPGSGSGYHVGPAEGPEEVQVVAMGDRFQPGSGTDYPSVPLSIPEGTMVGAPISPPGWLSGCPTEGHHQPLLGVRYNSAPYMVTSPHSAPGRSPMSGDPSNETDDSDLPTYDEAILRCKMASS